MWVGGRWVLTCAHVIGTEPRPVMVRFSFAGGEPVRAVVTPQGWLPEDRGDLALLELDRDPPPSARPAPLRRAHAVTGHGCAAYGYPAGHDRGVWSQAEITGQTVDRLQLTTRVVHGHQIEKGFSGTGLFDTETGAVVGLVVTRDRGRDVLGGFAIPIQAAAAAFPQLAPWVGWRLSTDRFLRQHWWPRARGVYEDTTPGRYFTGRTKLLRELTGWLGQDVPDRAVRVVTGPAGSGKSALLAWLCAVSDPQLRAEIIAAHSGALADSAPVPAAGQVKAAIWARGMDTSEAAAALAGTLALPVEAGAAVSEVLAAAGDLDLAERTGLVVAVDALDEAKTPREIVRRMLVPLARDLGIKVLSGTRPGRDGELLAAFGGRAVTYWLDSPAWFDHQDLADYAAACLRVGSNPAVPSGYRGKPDARRQVAEAIADAAGSNFLVAGLAARARADEPVIETSVIGWQNRQRFPVEVGEAFGDYLSRFGEDETRAQDLLRALAYAEGAGLPADELWAEMASGLAAPHHYSCNDLAWLLDSAAGYLVESGDEHGQPVYRLFHQALIEHLRPEDRETQRQRVLTTVLIRAVPSGNTAPDWAHAFSYIRRHLAAHAAAAGELDALLEDPAFLVATEPVGLLRVLDTANSPRSRDAAWIYRFAADRLRTPDLGERAAYLQLAAGKAGHRAIALKFGEIIPSSQWATHVLYWRRPGRYTALGSIDLAHVSALAVTVQEDVLIVGGLNDGTVALWRVSDDVLALAGDPRRGHDCKIQAVAVGQANSQAIAVTGGTDGTVALWRVSDDGLVLAGAPQRHAGWLGGVRAVAIGQAGSQTVAVTGGDDGTVALWRVSDDGLVLADDPQQGHGVLALSAVAVGQAAVVTGGRDGTVALWRVTDDGLVLAGDLQRGHNDGRLQVAVGQVGGQAVAVTGGADGTVALWRMGDDGLMLVSDPQLHGGDERVWAVGVGQAVAVTGGIDGTVALWRMGDDGLVLAGDPQGGHSGPVWAVAVGQVGGQTVAITVGTDRTVALWRLSETWLTPSDDPQHDIGRAFGGTAVAVGQVGGQTVAVTGRADGTVALWRIGDDGLVLAGDPQRGHSANIWAVAVGQVGGQAVAVSSGNDGMVALWRIGNDGLVLVGDPQAGHGDMLGVRAVAVGQVGGQAVAVTGGDDGMVALWRIGDDGLTLVGDPQPGHGDDVLALAVGQVGGQAVAVTGGSDGSLALWRIGNDGLTLVGDPRPGFDEAVWEVGIEQVGGQAVAVTGWSDGSLALWRIGDDGLTLVGDPQRGNGRAMGVRALAVGQVGGQAVALTGGWDSALQLWLQRDGELVKAPTALIPVGSPLADMALLPPDKVLTWCDDGVLLVTIPMLSTVARRY